MIDEVLLVRRQSPSWRDLSDDYRAGHRVEPSRYVPAGDIPGFPKEVDRLIATWNAIFRIDFFSCRLAMKTIAEASIRDAERVQRFEYTDTGPIMERSCEHSVLAFFHDDDDVFDAALWSRIRDVDAACFDVAVFPLPRLSTETFTFVRSGHVSTAVVGPEHPFHFRYQTNNYGITSRGLSEKRLILMKDHVEASAYADSSSISDHVFDFPVSATIKTPASASMLPCIVEETVRNSILRKFIDSLSADLPPTLQWLARPCSQTAQLFSLILSQATCRDLVDVGLLDS